MKNLLQKVYLSFLLMTAISVVVSAQTEAFFDGFESGGFTEKGWTQEPSTGVVPWSVNSSGVGAVTPFEKTKMALLFSPQYQVPVKLITPNINIGSYQEPFLSFYLAAETYHFASRDTLKVYYKEQGSNNWVLMRGYPQQNDNWEKKVIRLKDYTQAANIQIAFEHCYANGKGIALDSVKLYSATVCNPPSGLTVENITENSAVLRWAVNNYTNISKIKVSTTAINTANLDNTTANIVDTTTVIPYFPLYSGIHNLQENTQYYWYVKADCGPSDVSSWVSGTFRTRCRPIAEADILTQAIEGFETSPASGYPNCWIRTKDLIGDWLNEVVSESKYLPQVVSGKAKTGNKSLKIESFYQNNEAITIPRIVQSYAITQGMGWTYAKNYQVTFYAMAEEPGKKIHVGIMTNPDDVSTFEEQGVIQLTAENTWTQKTIYFLNNQNNGKHIAFMTTGADGNASNIVFIDDVKVEKIPDCPKPTDFKMATVSPSATSGKFDVVFSWNSLYPNHRYKIAISTNNQDPTRVNPMYETNPSVAAPNCTIQGQLNGLTKYYAFISNDCGQDWVGPITFTTPMASSNLPYSTGFETNDQWQLDNGTQSTKWYMGTAGKKEGNKGLYVSKDNGQTNSYNPSYNSKVLTYKKFKFAKDKFTEVTFYWRGNGSSTAYMVAYLVPENKENTLAAGASPDSTWIPLSGKLYGNMNWTRHVGSFKSPIATSYILAFQWVNEKADSENTPGIAVDQLDIKEVTCSAPTDIKIDSITDNSARISWKKGAVGSPANWKLQYGLASETNINNYTTVTVPGTQLSYTLTGLTQLSGYVVYITAECSNNAGNSYDVSAAFSTHQSPAQIPFNETFEGTVTMRAENGSQTNKWIVGSADKKDGQKSIYISKDNGTTRSYNITNATSYVYVYQTFDFDQNEVYQCSFNYKSGGESLKDVLNVFLVPDEVHSELVGGEANGMSDAQNTPPATWIKLADNPFYDINSRTTWQSYSNSFAVPRTGRYKIVFLWKNNVSSGTSNGAGALDNIKVEKIDCPAPFSINVTRNPDGTVTVTWPASQTATAWDVYYGTNTNALQGPNRVTTPSFTATDISQTIETVYYFKITTICGNATGDTKVHKYVVTTPFPYYTGFEEDTDNGQWTQKTYSGSNRWVVGGGQAADAVKEGLGALYISDSPTNTKVYRYNTSSTSKSAVYRAFTLEQGSKYRIMFDWKAQGDDSDDFLRACLVPEANATALKSNNAPAVTSSSLPSGWIDLGNGKMNQNNSMKNVQYDFIASSSGVYYIVFFWQNDDSGGSQPPAAIDQFYFMPNDCPMVTGIVVDNVAKSNAEIKWRSTGADSYDVKVSTTPISPETQNGDIVSSDNTTDTIYQINNLDPGTTYYVYVRANCGGGKSSYYNIEVITFSTLCDAIANLPYNMDFEQTVINQLPNCWSQNTQADGFSGSYRAQVNLDAATNNKRLYIDSYWIDTVGSTQVYAVMPEFQTPISQLQISFKVFGQTDKKISLTTMLDDGTGRVAPSGNILRQFDASPDGRDYTLVMSGVDLNNKYISFLSDGDVNHIGTVAVDNVVVKMADMCMAPNSVGHTDVTANSVKIYWDSPYYGQQVWNVVVTTVDISGDMSRLGSLQPSQIAYNQNVTIQLDPTVTITGLQPGQKYYYYIRKVCDNNTYGNWYQGPENMSFTTLCLSQDMCQITIVKQSTGTNDGWGNNTNLVFTREGNVIDTVRYVATAFGYGEADTRSYCANLYTLEFNKGSNTANVYFSIVDQNGDTVFRSYPNNNVKETFSFEILPGCDIFACEEVNNVTYTNVTTSGFTATWQGTGTSYTVKVYEGTNVTETSTPVKNQTVNTPTITVTGLNNNTTYTVVVISNCTSGSTSIQSNANYSTVRTLVEVPVEQVPINTTFDNQADNEKWLLYAPQNATNKWAIGTAINNGANSTKALYISNDNGTSHQYTANQATYAYATRYLQLQSGQDYHLTVDYMSKGEATKDLGRIFLIPSAYSQISEGYAYGMENTNNVPPADWLELSGGMLYNQNTWRQIDTVVSITNTDKYFLAFFWKNNTASAYQPPMAIDNLHFYAEECSQPSNLAVTNITSTSATATWQGTANSYDVKVTFQSSAYDPTSLQQIAGATDNATTSFAMTSLQPNTAYSVYIKSKCSGGKEAMWKKIDFKTDFNLDQLPLNTDFEQDAENSKWITSFSDGAANKWAFGSSTGNPNKSMYISQNDGQANTYNAYTESYAYAFRAYQLDAASEYKLKFHWKSQGQADKDLGRVFLIPASYKEQVVSGYHFGMNGQSNNSPADWIDVGGIDEVNILQGKTTWQTTEVQSIGVPTNGVYYLAFFWRNDASSANQAPLAVDNVQFELVPCPSPKNVTVTTSTTSATVTWIGTATTYELDLYDANNTAVTVNHQVVNNVNTYTFTGLTPGAMYLVKLRSQCASNLNSEYKELSFRAINSVDSLPINATFEDMVDNYMWHFSSYQNSTNKWRIGKGAKQAGQWGLYISNSTGGNGVDQSNAVQSANTYAIQDISYAYAYRKVSLKKSTPYAYSFYWMADGESSYDLLRAFIIPSTANISKGEPNAMTGNSNNAPSGWIDLNPQGGPMCKKDSYQVVDSAGLYVPRNDDYYIAFFWKNDRSSGSQPPASIDNFRFSEIRSVTVRDSVCIGYPYTRNNFDIPATSLQSLGDHTFNRIYTDPATGETLNMSLILKVMPGNEHRIKRVVCQGDTVVFFGRTIKAKQTAEYQHYTTAANGCDSIEVLELHVDPSYNIAIDTAVNNCDLPVTINGQLYEKGYPSGIWLATVEHKSMTGCDSIVTYAVNIYGDCTSQSIGDMRNVSFVPNPISKFESLTITGEFTPEEMLGLRIDVLNSTGQTIQAIKPEAMPVVLPSFNVSGVYIVRIVTGKGEIIYGKVIVN